MRQFLEPLPQSCPNPRQCQLKAVWKGWEGWEGKSRGGEFDTEYHQQMMKRTYSQDYYNTYLSPELGNLASRLSHWSDPIWNRFINDNGGIIKGKEFVVHELDGIDRYLKMLYKNKIEPNNCRN